MLLCDKTPGEWKNVSTIVNLCSQLTLTGVEYLVDLIGKISASEPYPKRQILDSSKLNEFTDETFKFDENGRKF